VQHLSHLPLFARSLTVFFSNIVLLTTPGNVEQHEAVTSAMVGNVDTTTQHDAKHSSAVHSEKRILSVLVRLTCF